MDGSRGRGPKPVGGPAPVPRAAKEGRNPRGVRAGDTNNCRADPRAPVSEMERGSRKAAVQMRVGVQAPGLA